MCVYTIAKHMTTTFLCKRSRSRNTKQPLNRKKYTMQIHGAKYVATTIEIIDYLAT